MEEGDDPYFDPKLYWAEVNGESTSLILMAKRQHETDLKIIASLKKSPKTAEHLCFEMSLTRNQIVGHLLRIKNRGVPLEKIPSKYSDATYRVRVK